MKFLLLDLDSMRPDHLGCYGYHRNTSPNIDRIAKEGVRFTNYYTSDAPCAPSRSALMSGQFGIHNGLVGHGGTAGDVRHDGTERGFSDRLARESLPAFLNQAGIKPVLISHLHKDMGRGTSMLAFVKFTIRVKTETNRQRT